MKIFCLDTTRKKARIYIYDLDKNFDYELELDENVKHSESVFLYIEKALFENNLSLKDFDVFSAVVGPGSFTGIRVGMSIIKGFAKVYNKKIIPVNNFEIIKEDLKNGYILLNSTLSSCYFAKIKSGQIAESGVIDKSNIVDMLGSSEVAILNDEQKDISIEYNNIKVLDSLLLNYKNVLVSKIDRNVDEDFLPFYLQLSQAERNLNNDNK